MVRSSKYVGRMNRQFGHLKRFIARQVVELRSAGGRVVLLKLRTMILVHAPRLTMRAVLLPWAVLGVIVVRSLRPLIQIRLSPINATRVGHLLLDVDMMLREDEVNRKPGGRPRLDIWYPWSGRLGVANQYILDVWRRKLNVLPKTIVEPIDWLNRMIPGGDANIFPYRKGMPNQLGQHHDICGVRRSVRSHFELSDEDLARAIRGAEDLGIQPNDKFVCLQVRDSAYLRWQTGTDWLDHPERNANIEDYVPAVKALVDAGYKVVRMGVVAERPLIGPWSEDSIVDLPFSGRRTELLDLYLGSRCSFFVTTGSGIDAVAHAMRVPLVTTNISDCVRDLFLTHESISIMRHPIEGDTARAIPMKEFFDRGLHLLKLEELTQKGVTFRHNSPSEIKNVIDEMVTAMEVGFEAFLGQHLDSVEQLEFRRCIPEWMLEGGVRGLISPSFLRGLQVFAT